MSVVLVEGRSDAAAVDALARRLGRDLAADGVEVLAIGGATNARRVALDLPPRTPVAALCDAREARYFDGLASLGLFVCDADLEDELIRALGTDAVTAVIDAAGDGRSLRTLQQQPAQRDRSTVQQLHRFMGTLGGRKVRYARLLVDALDLSRVPPPLGGLLAAI